MRIFKEVILVSAAVMLLVLHAHAAQANSIGVIGFINLGKKTDDSINTVITKSLTTFLAKLPEIKAASYDAVETMESNNNYWHEKAFSVDKATDFGLNLGVKEIISGDYMVDQKAQTIVINVYAYDTGTAELKLKRQYTGGAGLDIFDTIDKMIRNLSSQLVGHPVAIGKLQMDINSDKSYQLYLDGVFQKKITKKDGYSERIVGGRDLVVAIRLPDSGFDVYSNTIKVKDGETFNVSYAPTGAIKVEAEGYSGSEVLLNSTSAGRIGPGGELLIPNLKTGTNYTIVLKKEDKIAGIRYAEVTEGKSTSVIFVPTGKKAWSIPIHALLGGLGGAVGFDWTFWNTLRPTALVGEIYLSKAGLLYVGIDLGYRAFSLGDFNFWVIPGGMCYFTSPVTISPAVKLEIEWHGIFIEGGFRYGIDNSSINPLIGIGYRF